MIYLLDSNTFIQAKNLYYRMGFCPAYWSFLEREFQNDRIISIGMVFDELKKYGDELSDWVKTNQEHFEVEPDEATLEAFVQIVNYIQTINKPEIEKTKFLSVADPMLIAKAMTSGATLVTHEVLAPANANKIKIPNICQQFHVEYCNTYDMLEGLDARFLLE